MVRRWQNGVAMRLGLLVLVALSGAACSSRPEPIAAAVPAGLQLQLTTLQRQVEAQRQDAERLAAAQRQIAEALDRIETQAWSRREQAAIAPNLQADGQGRWCRMETIQTWGEQSGWSDAALKSCWDPGRGQWVLEQP